MYKVEILELVKSLSELEMVLNNRTQQRVMLESISHTPVLLFRIIPEVLIIQAIKKERAAIEDYLCLEQLIEDLSRAKAY